MLENSIPIQLDHDLGRFADIAALQAKYPTGRPGDFARLNSTDTIWYWNNTDWTDTNVSASKLTGGTIKFDEIDPATVATPTSGNFVGTYLGKLWVKDSTGAITYVYDELFALGY